MLCNSIPTVCVPPAPPAPQLHDRALQLQLAIQRMANIKEYRTPQVGGHRRGVECVQSGVMRMTCFFSAWPTSRSTARRICPSFFQHTGGCWGGLCPTFGSDNPGRYTSVARRRHTAGAGTQCATAWHHTTPAAAALVFLCAAANRGHRPGQCNHRKVRQLYGPLSLR